MRSRFQPLRGLGVAVWLLVGIACSQEALPTDGAARSPAGDVQAPQVEAEEARRRELLAQYAQEVATEDDRRRAEQGNADAQALLAVVYYNGRGVEVDHEEAVRWARLAADQGNARGQSMLAAAYFNGRGVEQDYAEAARWARPAAEAGRTGAQVILGTLYRHGNGVVQDYVAAYMWLSIAASNSGVAGTTGLIDRLASRMTREQLEEARARVREWDRW